MLTKTPPKIVTGFGHNPLSKSTCVSTEFNLSVTKKKISACRIQNNWGKLKKCLLVPFQPKKGAAGTEALESTGTSTKEKNQCGAAHRLGRASQKLSEPHKTVMKKAPSTCQV